MSAERAEPDAPTASPRDQAATGGHIYVQTNERVNKLIHYRRDPDGAITELTRYPTGGAGSAPFGYITDLAGLNVEGANGILFTPDRRFLFATNVGDNSVSSFAVAEDGELRLLDVARTGNAVVGKSGTAKSLAFAPSTRTLYVLHTIGPAHIRLFSVSDNGMLSLRTERYKVVPEDKPDRITTMIVLSPDEQFLLVGCSVDHLPATNPDGTPIVWEIRNNKPHAIAANAPDPDGLAVLAVGKDGALGDPIFQDSGASSPWCPVFLNNRPDKFIIGYATADGVALATLHPDGRVTTGPVVRARTPYGGPSELCWMTITPDDSLVFATMTGFSYVSSWRLEGNALTLAGDPACPPVPGDGCFRGFAGITGAAPTDMWLTDDGRFLYQIYPNASKLIGYAVQADGMLEEITRAVIPHNSPHSIAGF